MYTGRFSVSKGEIVYANNPELATLIQHYSHDIASKSPNISHDDLSLMAFRILIKLEDLDDRYKATEKKQQQEFGIIKSQLYNEIIQFYQLANNKWMVTGKYAISALNEIDPNICDTICDTFISLNIEDIDNLINGILNFYGCGRQDIFNDMQFDL